MAHDLLVVVNVVVVNRGDHMTGAAADEASDSSAAGADTGLTAGAIASNLAAAHALVADKAWRRSRELW
jgi:hypothetical protein